MNMQMQSGIKLTDEHRFINNNTMYALTQMMDKVDAVLMIMESYVDTLDKETQLNIQRGVSKRMYVDMLVAKDNNRNPDLESRKAISESIARYRENMVKSFGEDFVASVEDTYALHKMGDGNGSNRKII